MILLNLLVQVQVPELSRHLLQAPELESMQALAQELQVLALELLVAVLEDPFAVELLASHPFEHRHLGYCLHHHYHRHLRYYHLQPHRLGASGASVRSADPIRPKAAHCLQKQGYLCIR